MIYKTYNLTILLGFFFVTMTNAQIGGNQLYQNSSANYLDLPFKNQSMYSTDSTLVVRSKVLLNQEADYYTVTIGLAAEENSVAAANQKINQKINKVINQIKKIGISKEDVYVDFIAQIKLYDFKTQDKNIQEYLDGIGIKKNLIIQAKDLSQIHLIIEICAKEEIYDIVNVEYKIKNLDKINQTLFSQALQITKNKAKRFAQNSSIPLTNRYRISSENLKCYYPKNLYRQYNEPHEASEVKSYYNSSYTKQELRKQQTFFYNGVETQIGLDKIIDQISPKVGIQCILELVLTYELNN